MPDFPVAYVRQIIANVAKIMINLSSDTRMCVYMGGLCEEKPFFIATRVRYSRRGGWGVWDCEVKEINCSSRLKTK